MTTWAGANSQLIYFLLFHVPKTIPFLVHSDNANNRAYDTYNFTGSGVDSVGVILALAFVVPRRVLDRYH